MAKYTVQRLLAENLTAVFREIRFPLFQHKALQSFAKCRTAALGGNAQYCKNGHLNGIWYNSCRHRACPQCQSKASEQWLQNTKRILLDCPHHHIIFTIPSEFNPIFRYNRSIMIDILFRASRETLQQFAKDDRYLGAILGMIASLHTWGRNMFLHPHLHILTTDGGIDAKKSWRKPKKKILFPREPVMQVFRGKFLAFVKDALLHNNIVLPKDQDLKSVLSTCQQLYKKQWVVHFCKRYEYASGVAKYLARYVKSGPMRNSQLHLGKRGFVKFSYRSHQTKRTEVRHLRIRDFVRLLIQHVPPSGKRTTRYWGIYHPNSRVSLDAARQELGMQPVIPEAEFSWQQYMDSIGRTPVCSVCGEPIGPCDEEEMASSVA